MMRYLGALRGAGMLNSAAAEPLGRVDYELDAYVVHSGEVVASGEIRMDPGALNEAFGQNKLSLQTDDGRTLGVYFSGKRTSSNSDAAHADIRGGLPDAKGWRALGRG